MPKGTTILDELATERSLAQLQQKSAMSRTADLGRLQRGTQDRPKRSDVGFEPNLHLGFSCFLRLQHKKSPHVLGSWGYDAVLKSAVDRLLSDDRGCSPRASPPARFPKLTTKNTKNCDLFLWTRGDRVKVTVKSALARCFSRATGGMLKDYY